MSEVKAITPIQHGNDDGSVTTFAVGDNLDEGTFGEDGLRALVENGSAVEIGKDRNYSEPPASPNVGAAVDNEATLLRDDLIAQSNMADAPEPPAETDKPKSVKV